MAKSKYTECPKCRVRHSTLVRHRCFKPEEQKKKPKPDPEHKEYDLEKGGETESLDRHGGPEQGEGEGEGEGQGKGQPEQGDGEGGGGGEAGEGEGEGEGEGGEGESEAPEPQPPEPEAHPVAVVCTVLKFAALTAQCAKNGVISVELTEEGLSIYGHNGDNTASAVIPWGEFETRSTVDGQFYVKEVIDQIDEQIIEGSAKRLALTLPLSVAQWVMLRNGEVTQVEKVVGGSDTRPIAVFANRTAVHADTGLTDLHGKAECVTDAVADAEAPKVPKPPKAEKPKEPEAPKLTLPLTEGQKVVARNGRVGTVEQIRLSPSIRGEDEEEILAAKVVYERVSWWHEAETGLFRTYEDDPDYEWHLVADAPEPKAKRKSRKAKLTLPLTVGQLVVRESGTKVRIIKVTAGIAEGDDGYCTFDDGKTGTLGGHYDVVADA